MGAEVTIPTGLGEMPAYPAMPSTEPPWPGDIEAARRWLVGQDGASGRVAAFFHTYLDD